MLEKMRQCRLNFAEHRYDCEAGIVGEHNATELIITPPAIMPDEAVYRLCFEPGGVSEIIPKMSDGALAYPLPAAVTATAFCCVTLTGYIGNEQVYKSRMVQLHFCRAADGDTDIDPQQPGIVTEVNRNTAARHTHENKAVLDKFSESDGKPIYDGKEIGGTGGSSDLIIKMTVAYNDDDSYTVTSCDATVEQIDAAVAAGKRVVVATTVDSAAFELQFLQGIQGESYYFGSFILGQTAAAYVWKDTSSGISTWTFGMYQIEAGAIDYSNNAMTGVSSVEDALNELARRAIPKKITSGTAITLADNTEYRLTDVTTLTLTYPTGNFECWMRLTFAESGTITVTLPTETKYIGTAPDFKNGETWELSFKDKVLAAQKVGEGT